LANLLNINQLCIGFSDHVEEVGDILGPNVGYDLFKEEIDGVSKEL
jgi:hypothetical protein